jgi:hypothetical protein
MDRTRIKEDFQKFLAEHPEAVISKNGLRLFVSSELSTFCFEYDYPLDYARKTLKKLGVLGSQAFTAWDPEKQGHISCYVLGGDADFSIDELIKEAKQIIEQKRKIVWRKCLWLSKEHLLPLCEKYKITYCHLLRILREHGLIAETKTVYDPETAELTNAVEILQSDWEKEVVERAKRMLEQKTISGEFITQESLMYLAKDIGVRYKSFVNLMRKNGVIGERMEVFRIMRRA